VRVANQCVDECFYSCVCVFRRDSDYLLSATSEKCVAVCVRVLQCVYVRCNVCTSIAVCVRVC